VVVKSELFALFDFFLGVVQPLLNDICRFCASLLESFLKGFKVRSIDEEVVTINVVVMYLLGPLNINIENAYLSEKKGTFPLFMTSISFPLWVP